MPSSLLNGFEKLLREQEEELSARVTRFNALLDRARSKSTASNEKESEPTAQPLQEYSAYQPSPSWIVSSYMDAVRISVTQLYVEGLLKDADLIDSLSDLFTYKIKHLMKALQVLPHAELMASLESEEKIAFIEDQTKGFTPEFANYVTKIAKIKRQLEEAASEYKNVDDKLNSRLGYELGRLMGFARVSQVEVRLLIEIAEPEDEKTPAAKTSEETKLPLIFGKGEREYKATDADVARAFQLATELMEYDLKNPANSNWAKKTKKRSIAVRFITLEEARAGKSLLTP